MNSVIRQALFYGVGLLVMKGISFIMLPIVTRYLPVEEYGRLDVLVTLMNVGSIVAGFGIVEAVYRYYGFAKSDQERGVIVSSGFMMSALLSLVLLITALPFLPILTALIPGNLEAKSITLALINVAIGGITTVPLAWLRMRDLAQWFFVFTSVKAVIQGVMTFVLLDFGWGVDGVLWSGLISNILLMVALVFFQWRQGGMTIDTAVAKKMLVYGLPLVFGGICVFVSGGLERWVLAGYTDTATLAKYGVASMFALVVAFLVEPFTLWWYPKRFEFLGADDGRALNAYYSSVGVSLSVLSAMLMCMVGPILIKLILPESYHDAALILPVLAAAMAIKQSAHLMNVGCYVGGSTSLPTKINVVLAAFSLIVYPLTVFLNGVEGVIVGVLMINILRFALFYFFSQKALYLQYPLTFLIRQGFCLVILVLMGSQQPSFYSVLILSFAVFDSAVFIKRKKLGFDLHNTRSAAGNI